MSIKFDNRQDRSFFEVTSKMDFVKYTALMATILRVAIQQGCVLTLQGEIEKTMFIGVEYENMILFGITNQNDEVVLFGGIHWDGKEWSSHT